MLDDETRLSEFRKVLRQYAHEQVVDLDEKYTHKFNFQIHRYEDVLRNSKRASPPHRWSYHRIALITQGEGEVTVGIHRFKAKKNTLALIPSRIISCTRDWTLDTTGYVALFNMDFFLQNNFSPQIIENKRILNSSIQPFIHLSDENGREVGDIFQTIFMEKHSDHPNKYELIALKILELLIFCERMFEQELDSISTPPSIDILKRFLDLLDTHFSQEHSVKFYADQLLIHPNHLNMLIKKHSGLTAKESIQNRLLLEIKYLLHSTDLSIKQIANQMGFSDPNYFTTFFTRFEQVSPVGYRTAYV
jgi:AraC family transcriptional regulator, transcriptional activator of pobA